MIYFLIMIMDGYELKTRPFKLFFPCLCSSFGVSGAKLLMPRVAILYLFALGEGSFGNDLTGCPGKSWVRDD